MPFGSADVLSSGHGAFFWWRVVLDTKQSSTRWAITAQFSQKEALLHQVTSAQTVGRQGELGTCSLGATAARSGLLFLFPSLSLSSHTTVAHKAHSTFTEEKFSCLWFNRSSIFSRERLFGLWSLLLSSLRVYLRKGWEILPFHCNPVCTNHVQDLTLLKATAALVSDFTWPLFHI